MTIQTKINPKKSKRLQLNDKNAMVDIQVENRDSDALK